MSKIAHYLQEHLLGEVTTSADARAELSTDASIFSAVPNVIVYPRNEHDVRKTVRFAWQLAERQRPIPVTARGAGTDYSGAAIGNGIVIVFPAHMNRIIQLDNKTGTIIVEPGLSYGRLQQTLHTHERFLPPYPSSFQYSTIGGAVANNASGEKSYKYGSTKEYVKGLRVVLSNGEVITTGRLSKRELAKKMGLSTFEGEIYRQIDALIEENREVVEKLRPRTSKSTAGYNVDDVKFPNGSFDLTPLFVGSQGTLGIVTEITMTTEDFNPETVLIMAGFDSIEAVTETIEICNNMSEKPSILEMVDSHLLSFVNRLNPNQLKGCIDTPYPRYVLFIEFDDNSHTARRRAVKKLGRELDRLATSHTVAESHADQMKIWKVRQSSASLLSHSEKRLKPIPIIDDACVPVEKIGEFLMAAQTLFVAEKLQFAVWGNVGDGNLHMLPFIDISELGERQKAFRLYDKFYATVLALGGTTTGQYGDGRLRGSLLPKLYGSDGYDVLVKLKKVLDPYNIMNTGVKIGTNMDDIKLELRDNYTLGHIHNHMPHN